MKIFRIQEDKDRKSSGFIDAAHKWGLPGVSCPVCGQIWAGTGFEYPTIDLSFLPEKHLFEEPRVVSLRELEKMKEILEKAFPRLRKIGPGTLLGQMVGRSSGELDGFVWHNPWTLLVTGDALRQLSKYELSLPSTATPDLKFMASSTEIFEWEILPFGTLLNGVYNPGETKICPACRRDSATIPARLVVEKGSLTGIPDIFRLSNFATVIIVTERFLNAVKTSNIPGSRFSEVAVQ
jgi:uncharacterized double-CXXCG motif protein